MSKIKVDMTSILCEGYPSNINEDYIDYVKYMKGDFGFTIGTYVSSGCVNLEIEVDDEQLPVGVTPQMVGDSIGVIYSIWFTSFADKVKGRK